MNGASGKKTKAQHGSGLSTSFLKLRELILAGDLAPGSWIVEANLAERLGLSRTPIRSALQLLQRDGYVVEHKIGTKTRMSIAPLTVEDAEESCRIVAGLEGIAGYRIGTFDAAVREQLADSLETINSQFNMTAKKGQIARPHYEVDASFHLMIVEAAAGPHLLSLHHSAKSRVERYARSFSISAVSVSLRQFAVQEHKEIITAVRKGRSRQIEIAIQKNWMNGFNRALQISTV